MAKVSVIIPIYNSEKYLKMCIESILNQTIRDIEIIMVDDGSTDNSLEIIKNYQKKDDRIIVLQQQNKGAGSARNYGMDQASGEYYLFLDSDDFFEPDMLEKSYELASNNQLDIVVMGCDIYKEQHDVFEFCNYSIQKTLLPKKRVFKMSDVKKDVFKTFVGWPWDKLIRADFIKDKNIRFEEQRTTNDMYFIFIALLLANRISIIDEVYVHYRQNEVSLSKTREYSWTCFYNSLNNIRRKMKEESIFQIYERDYINYCLHFCLWNINTLKPEIKQKLINELRKSWVENLNIRLDINYYYNKREYSDFIFNVYDIKKDIKYPLYKLNENLSRLINLTYRCGIINSIIYLINKMTHGCNY